MLCVLLLLLLYRRRVPTLMGVDCDEHCLMMRARGAANIVSDLRQELGVGAECLDSE